MCVRWNVEAPARQDARHIPALLVLPGGRWLESGCSGGVILESRAAAPETPPRAHTLSTHSRMNTPHEARMSDMAVNLFGSGLGSSLKLQRPSRAKLKFMHFSDAMLRCVHFKLRVCTAKTAKS